jgi:hypothetical protein
MLSRTKKLLSVPSVEFISHGTAARKAVLLRSSKDVMGNSHRGQSVLSARFARGSSSAFAEQKLKEKCQ